MRTDGKFETNVNINFHRIIQNHARNTQLPCFLNSGFCYNDIIGDGRYKRCFYYHVGQNIIGRNGEFLGVELLSRLINPLENPIDYEDYFHALNQHKHKQLLLELLNKLILYILSDNGPINTRYFINVERFSLLDSEIVSKIIRADEIIRYHNHSRIVIEVTERNSELCRFTIENKYELKDAGILLAMDDSTIQRLEMLGANFRLYDYLKFDMRFIRETVSDERDRERFLEFLYWCVENNVRLIAERVEFKEDYSLANYLPFHYMQGFYEILNQLPK